MIHSFSRKLLFVLSMLMLTAPPVVVIAPPLSAQVEAGQIAGTVSDPSAAVVPGATVTVVNIATGARRQTLSSASGTWQVTGLDPGTYKVTVTTASFRPFSANVEVIVGGHLTLDAKLSLSSNVTEIQVQGEGGASVNTQTQELSQVVDTNQLAQLPSLTRNPYDFVMLSGNVSNGDNTTPNMNSGQRSTPNRHRGPARRRGKRQRLFRRGG